MSNEAGYDVKSLGRKRRVAEAPADTSIVIASLLEPGETLIWSANGRGPHWTPQNIFNLAFVAVVIVVFGIGIFSSMHGGQTSGWMLFFASGASVCASAALIAGVLYAVFCPNRDCYGLTERRMIVVWRCWPGRIRSYSASNIQALRVRSGKTGDITFWKQSSRYVNRAWAIVGIDDPLAIANLISKTLHLELPIEDIGSIVDAPPKEL